MKISTFISIITLSSSLIMLNSCQTIPIGEMSQDDGITLIRVEYNDKSWSEVINNVDEYKTRYPYSKFNIEAELMQADAYYQSDRYPECIAAYEDFIRKNPSNPSVSLAHYRIGVSYDYQAPTAIDKEQLNAKKAMAKYLFYLKNFPKSEYEKDVRERIEILNRRIAEHEDFIANFYWRKDQYSASLARYLSLVKNYGQYTDLKKQAIEKISKCYDKLADQLEEDPISEEFITFKNTTPEDLRKKAQEYKN
ncbi:outer membrane protein assembly factor BamD [Fluviispira multicolorata]|uniref:Outer membrane protein assembly factor BamD n=1 Tax=Fluviispira multicolorata TaxID=2654512 RepID=A0A833JDK5_9BACT|nr:outer membrane protein assembly factor BamD [Fluviispira multicolorata]KAB8028536.1 outer membrane protein assembly factor BamD [Fluviispira multicolorata]